MSGAATPIRVILVGLGVMGDHHLRVLGSLPGVEIVAMVDPDVGRRTMAKAVQQSAADYGRLEEALAVHELDLACLAVPVQKLPTCAEATLAAGLHTFAEKPLALSEEAAASLIELAAERERLLMVGHVERFNPAVIALKEKLDQGMIGRILQMHARRLSPFPNRSHGTGVALDLATHDIDVMRFLSSTEVNRVYAESVARVSEPSDDLICATLRFDDETTGLLEANWITPTKVRQLSVLGEGGMFVVDYLTQDLVFYEHPTSPTDWDQLAGIRGGGEGDMIRFALQRREPLRVEWESCIAAVRAGAAAPVDGRDGLAALSVGRAIQHSAVTHEIVSPSYRGLAAV